MTSTNKSNGKPGLSGAAGSPSGKREMPEAARKEYMEVLRWINDYPRIFSLLYDLDRLPEQLEEGSKAWCEMVNIVAHMKDFYEEGQASVANAKIGNAAGRETQP